MSEKQYLSILEASKQYNVSRTHIYNRIKAGKIATMDLHGTTLVLETDVQDYVSNLKRRTKKVKKQKKQNKTSNIAIDSYIETNAKKKELPIAEILGVIFGGIVGFVIAYFLF